MNSYKVKLQAFQQRHRTIRHGDMVFGREPPCPTTCETSAEDQQVGKGLRGSDDISSYGSRKAKIY
jgi:hypothetical protein